ncbi:MAG: NAD-dependent epimerase/dehydratase family protein [Flavobacterium sp.]|nr:MAG: NAD-dependent epimerase/dehydratase family protein [Flavobacterium sp.]
MRILVTGAAGFIGSHLCEKLVSLGHEVLGIDNFNDYYDPALKRMNEADLKEIGVDIAHTDLNAPLDSLLENPFDYIFHLAAQPGISSDTSLEEYVTNNIYATQNLLEAAMRNNSELKSFVNIATSSVYGKEATIGEEIPPAPISFYGITKWAAEQLALGLHREGKINACSIRLYSVYGPRERPEKLYTRLIDNLYNDKPFPLYEGSIAHQRSFTYVGDIVDGLAAIIGRETSVNGEIINLGTDEINTTAEGIAAVEQIMNKKLIIEHKPPRKGDQLKTAAVIDKARKLLGYQPKVSLHEGLQKQVDWYLEKFTR